MFSRDPKGSALTPDFSLLSSHDVRSVCITGILSEVQAVMPIIGVIVQARLGSRRVFGKTLKTVLGRPLIAYVMDQVRAARQLDTVILATSDRAQDDPVAELGASQGWKVFRGSADDVLDRFYHAAIEHNLDAVVRITGDCPLKDPAIIDWVVCTFRQQADIDYVATNLEPRLPLGMDVDMFAMSALERAWRHAELPSEREHVNPFLRKHPDLFRHHSLVYPQDLTRYRVAVDEPEDFVVVQRIIESLHEPGKVFHLQEVVDFLEQNPHVARVNADLVHNQGYLESLKGDLELMDIRIPRHLQRREWRLYIARAVSKRMGASCESSQVVLTEAPTEEMIPFEVTLRGDILDAVDLREVRLPGRARLEEVEASAQPPEPVRSP